HFEIERQIDFPDQPFDVLVRNMPPVFAQMSGNAVRPGGGCKLCRAHGIGMPATAVIPYRRHMIDVHAKTKAVHNPIRGPARPCCPVSHQRCFSDAPAACLLPRREGRPAPTPRTVHPISLFRLNDRLSKSPRPVCPPPRGLPPGIRAKTGPL